jgi:hypothetical protein
VVDERREDALRLTQVVGNGATRVAADERADGNASQLGGDVDAGAQVGVVALALGGIGRKVVVVVRERGDDEPVLLEDPADALRLRGGSAVAVRPDVARREGAVAELRPGGELERLVAVGPCPGGDLLEAALRHAGGEEAELHQAAVLDAAGVRATSTQRSSRAEVRTASVISDARRPSVKVGIPSTSAPPRIES